MFWYVVVLCRLSNYVWIKHVKHLICRWPQVEIEVVGKIVLLLDAQSEDYFISILLVHDSSDNINVR
jgi:hypothetical protein